nr:AlkA N-terminal domain-containing protein [Cryobacterium sp. TMT2-10]
MSSRDARFDGQFITGVHSTGIYCRPSCPAATPKPANVSFYLTTAAAHEAGLRACKRCLPDAVPGSPEWNIRDDLAARAMRLIADGAVERDGVPGLARRLGYSERHLTRVLVTELGAGPLALARAHRAQTARLLLQGSELSISAVAFAAGFGSVRQFNDTIAAVYERTPTELRRTLQRPTRPARPRSPSPESAQAVPSAATGISLQLPARAPFDGPGLLRFLAVRALAGVERATAQVYSRTLRLPHGPAWVELTLLGTDAAPSVACRAGLASLADLAPLVSRVRRLLDLDADSRAIDLALAADPALAAGVAATPGMRLPGSIDPEETLFRALIGQQVSVAAARTALTRLTAALGDAFPGAAGAPAPGGDQPGTDQPGTDQHGSDQPLRLFPTAARIAAEGARLRPAAPALPHRRADRRGGPQRAPRPGRPHRHDHAGGRGAEHGRPHALLRRYQGGPRVAAHRPPRDRALDGRLRRAARAGQSRHPADQRPGPAPGRRPTRTAPGCPESRAPRGGLGAVAQLRGHAPVAGRGHPGGGPAPHPFFGQVA